MPEKYTIKKSSLYLSINQECATAPWNELERFFASGNMISIDKSLDLIEVAYEITMDNTQFIEKEMSSKRIITVDDKQALLWSEQDSLLWTVVIKPWILVQDKS